MNEERENQSVLITYVRLPPADLASPDTVAQWRIGRGKDGEYEEGHPVPCSNCDGQQYPGFSHALAHNFLLWDRAAPDRPPTRHVVQTQVHPFNC